MSGVHIMKVNQVFLLKLNNMWKDILVIKGEIIDIDKNQVVIDCYLGGEGNDRIFQVRRFDLDPFIDVVDLKIGNFVQIKITTTRGKRVFEFSNEESDLKELFNKLQLLLNREEEIKKSGKIF
jgi:hypothetical protein